MRGSLEKIVLIVLGMVILGYLYYTYYLSSEIATINTLKKNIVSTKQTIRKLENENKTINSKIEQEKNRSSEFNEAIPDKFDKKEIIKYLYDQINNTYGLKSDVVAFTESKGKDYKIGTASFKVIGTYDNVRSFMKKLEDDKRKFVIKQASMGSDGETYSSTVLVEFYALK